MQIISLAPLQGYTEYTFRNNLAEIVGGVDKFYTPFLRFENDGTIRKKHLNDIDPENNVGLQLVPQILVNNAVQFLQIAAHIQALGYTEINWNIGCPYPMVAKRKLGSGLLPYPQIIDAVLNEVCRKTSLAISIKLRSGYENDQEIFNVIKVLNQYPIKEIIYHPRVGKQLYKGEANFEHFLEAQNLCKSQMAYNGDINSYEKFTEIVKRMPSIKHLMIGRGLLINPFLAREIKEGKPLAKDEKRELFCKFHDHLLQNCKNYLSGDSHVLNKSVHYWEYFSQLFVEHKKVYKAIKKCKTVANFEAASNKFIHTFDFI